MARQQLVLRLVQVALVAVCLIPIAVLLWRGFHDELSANPISDITKETGVWTLRLIVTGLAISPLRRFTGWSVFARYRRTIGLMAFFYACLHFTTYIWLDKFFDVDEMIRDVAKRPFITVGFTTFLLLIPLAATSTNRIMKWMGGKNWKRLHRLVYICGVGGVVHYLWLVKADKHRPVIYGVIVAFLLGVRLWDYFRTRPRKAKIGAASSQFVSAGAQQAD